MVPEVVGVVVGAVVIALVANDAVRLALAEVFKTVAPDLGVSTSAAGPNIVVFGFDVEASSAADIIGEDVGIFSLFGDMVGSESEEM